MLNIGCRKSWKIDFSFVKILDLLNFWEYEVNYNFEIK